MNNDGLIMAGVGIMISLQGWILLSIVGLRERVATVETKVDICTEHCNK
jgi:hypothetical protein